MSTPPIVRLPVGVEPLSVATRRARLATLSAGTAGQARLVLVPGFTGSKEDFLPAMPMLAAAGLHVQAIDQLGQYESTGTGNADDYSLTAYALDILDLLVDAPAHVVGHSYGGLVCRAAAIERPERFLSLTLLDSGPAAVPEEFRAQLDVLRQVIPSLSLEQIWQLKELQDREAGVLEPPPDVHEFLHRRWLATDPWSLYAMAGTLMGSPDLTKDLAAVRSEHGLPVLVAYGESDETAWPIPEQTHMARRLDACCVSIGDAAHSPAVENPGRTAEVLLDFIRS